MLVERFVVVEKEQPLLVLSLENSDAILVHSEKTHAAKSVNAARGEHAAKKTNAAKHFASPRVKAKKVKPHSLDRKRRGLKHTGSLRSPDMKSPELADL